MDPRIPLAFWATRVHLTQISSLLMFLKVICKENHLWLSGIHCSYSCSWNPQASGFSSPHYWSGGCPRKYWHFVEQDFCSKWGKGSKNQSRLPEFFVFFNPPSLEIRMVSLLLLCYLFSRTSKNITGSIKKEFQVREHIKTWSLVIPLNLMRKKVFPSLRRALFLCSKIYNNAVCTRLLYR